MVQIFGSGETKFIKPGFSLCSTIGSLVISLHPQLFDVNTSRYIDRLFQENSFQVCSLNILFRNSAQIVNYFKIRDTLILTHVYRSQQRVLLLFFNMETLISISALEALTNKKFVCVYEEKFKREIFLQELRKKNVDLFDITNLNTNRIRIAVFQEVYNFTWCYHKTNPINWNHIDQMHICYKAQQPLQVQKNEILDSKSELLI